MTQEWVTKVIDEIAQFGKRDCGIYREAFSEADDKARNYIIELMKQVGLKVRTDEIGNIIGRLEVGDNKAPAVVTGSHLDTVPGGSKYDGVIGVVGGLAAILRLKERKVTQPLELIVFAAEESSRFMFATMGSKAMIGRSNINSWRKAKDKNDISFVEVMSSRGLDINNIDKAARSKDAIKAFVELHIEQGNTLVSQPAAIGIVDVVAAPTRLKITVDGLANYSGTTPMNIRRDALVSASMIVLAIQEIALEQSYYGTVATVGALKVHPGAINVIPGQVEMWVDIRGVNHSSIIECLQEIKDAVSTVAEGQDTSMSIEMLSSEKPVEMDKEVAKIIENVCDSKGLSYVQMNSGAGHDAMNMAFLAPTGMIFIPSYNDISHCADEYATPNDIETGIQVLTETLFQLAK